MSGRLYFKGRKSTFESRQKYLIYLLVSGATDIIMLSFLNVFHAEILAVGEEQISKAISLSCQNEKSAMNKTLLFMTSQYKNRSSWLVLTYTLQFCGIFCLKVCQKVWTSTEVL